MLHNVLCFFFSTFYLWNSQYTAVLAVKSVKSAINVPIAAPFTTVNCNYRHSWHLWFASWDLLRSSVSPRRLALENNAHRFAQIFQVHDISSVSLQCLHWCLLCMAHKSRTVKDKKWDSWAISVIYARYYQDILFVWFSQNVLIACSMF